MIKKNFFLNNSNNLIKLLFPIIIFPYISRILQPETKGIVDFSLSIVAYFIILSSLGIPIYGIREVSRCRDNKSELAKLIAELLILNILSTIVCILIYFIFIYSSKKLYMNLNIYIILSLNIIFTPLGIEWFYQGMQEYKYIVIRNIFIQILSLVLILLLVKTKDDYVNYIWINVFQNIGMNFFNFFNLKKFIKFSDIKLKNLEYKKHLKAVSVTFVMRLASTIYVNLDTTMLGYLANDKSVAFYTAGIKFNKILVTVGTSLSTVIIPKINYFFKIGDKTKVKELNRMTIDFVFFFSIPSMLGLILFAPNIIKIFLGDEYIRSILSMRLMVPIILFMGLSNFLGVQVLYTNNQEKKMMISLIIGAISNVIFNVLLIPKFLENGAAIGTLVAEFGVLMTQYIFAKKYIEDKIINNSVKKYIFSGVISFLIVKIVLMQNIFENNLIELLIYSILFSLSYVLIIYLIKEKNLTKFIKGVE